MRSWVDREIYTVSLHWCTGGERHAGGSNHLSEHFETHTRLGHLLSSGNSLCVHRLQVQHCMLVWDWQLCPPHCSFEYVQYVWVQYWTVSLVWYRDRNSGHVYTHRELFFFLHMITHVTWFHVTKCQRHNSATVLLYTLLLLHLSESCIYYLQKKPNKT